MAKSNLERGRGSGDDVESSIGFGFESDGFLAVLIEILGGVFIRSYARLISIFYAFFQFSSTSILLREPIVENVELAVFGSKELKTICSFR